MVSIAVLYLAGAAFDVRLSAGEWVQMTVLILVGLIPFAVLGILLGHLLTIDSMGPALGGVTSLFALLGGAWGPTADERLAAAARQVPAVVLAGAGRQDGLRRRLLAAAGVDRAGRVDRRSQRPRGVGLPP